MASYSFTTHTFHKSYGWRPRPSGHKSHIREVLPLSTLLSHRNLAKEYRSRLSFLAANSSFNYATGSCKWRTAFHVFYINIVMRIFPMLTGTTRRSGFWWVRSHGKPSNVIALPWVWQQVQPVSERYSVQGLVWELAAWTKVFRSSLLPCEYQEGALFNNALLHVILWRIRWKNESD